MLVKFKHNKFDYTYDTVRQTATWKKGREIGGPIVVDLLDNKSAFVRALKKRLDKK